MLKCSLQVIQISCCPVLVKVELTQVGLPLCTRPFYNYGRSQVNYASFSHIDMKHLPLSLFLSVSVAWVCNIGRSGSRVSDVVMGLSLMQLSPFDVDLESRDGIIAAVHDSSAISI